jgi:amino acid transporter
MSHGSFVSHLNSFSRPFTHQADTYHSTITTAVKGGLQLPDHAGGYSTGNTLGAIYPIIGAAIMWVWWGVYLAAEMKGGGRRNRQLTGIFGAGLGQGLLVLVGAAIFLKTIGYDFFAAANSGAYGVPVAPYFGFFAAIGVHSNLIAILISFAVIFSFPPAVYINLAMCQRAPFAWAWDGLAPQWLTRVSDRYHTPVASILLTFVLVIATTAWAAFSTSFATIFTVFTLTGFVTITITGLSAIVMAWRRPELYRGSAADWKILGIPVLPVAGVGAVAFAVFMIIEAIRFHTELGVSSLAELLGPPVGVIVVGILYYLGARAYQQSRGIDLDLAYKSIPPD